MKSQFIDGPQTIYKYEVEHLDHLTYGNDGRTQNPSKVELFIFIRSVFGVPLQNY